MAGSAPYDQLVGTLSFYLAPVGTAEPTINATPSGAWIPIGTTDGEQVISQEGDLTKFYDNDHQGPVKAVRPQEDPVIKGRLVGLTLENLARLISNVANVVSSGSSPAIRRLPLRQGFLPTEYALLVKGSADSPYGIYPGQHYLPRGVFAGKYVRTRSKTARDFVDFEFHVLEDDSQSEENRLGWLTVQTG